MGVMRFSFARFNFIEAYGFQAALNLHRVRSKAAHPTPCFLNAGAVFGQTKNQTAPLTACLQAVRLPLKAQNVLKKHFQAAFSH